MLERSESTGINSVDVGTKTFIQNGDEAEKDFKPLVHLIRGDGLDLKSDICTIKDIFKPLVVKFSDRDQEDPRLRPENAEVRSRLL